MRMNTPAGGESRVRAYTQFLIAILYFILARILATHGAQGLVSDAWFPLASQAMLVFLLLVGYSSLGFWQNHQINPMKEQGLPLRTGWFHEAGVGVAVGWAVAVVCVLPMTWNGGIAILLFTHLSAWNWLLADAAYFALATLAEEIAFRGYGFQRLMHAVGPVAATIGFAGVYALIQSFLPGASFISFVVSLILGVVLTMAYLRTRALWVSWGLNFGWKASRALLFGLAVNGVSTHSPVVQGNPMGPYWVTGGGFGLDGTWIALVVLLAAMPVVYRVTRELDFQYNAPVIVPGGIAVDLDEAARRQHEAAMAEKAPAEPLLVQIVPGAVPTQAKLPEEIPPGGSAAAQSDSA